MHIGELTQKNHYVHIQYQNDHGKESVLTYTYELNSHNYLILVDYYSGFIEVEELHSTKSEQIIYFTHFTKIN